MCPAHATPHLHREQSPRQLEEGLQFLLPAPAASPLPSLTFAESLELFFLLPQVLPGHPWEHRARHGPSGTAPCPRHCSPVATRPGAPAGLSPGPCRMLTPKGTAARAAGAPQRRARMALPGQQAGLGPNCAGAGRGGSPGLWLTKEPDGKDCGKDSRGLSR